MADIPLLADSPQLVSFNICRGSTNVKFLELQEKLFNPSPRNIAVRPVDSPQKLFNPSPRNIAVRLADSPQLASFNICRGSPNVKFLELREKLFNPSPRNIAVRLADSPQKLFNPSPRNIAVRLADSPQKLFNPLSPAKAPRLFKLATSYLEIISGTPHEIGYFMRGWDTNGNFVYWSSTAAPNLSPVTTIPTLVGSLTNICLIGTTTT